MSRSRARAIVDRNFDKLSFTTEARALTFQPTKIRKQLVEAKQKSPAARIPTSGSPRSPAMCRPN